MPLPSSGELSFSAITYYLFNPFDLDPDPYSIYWFYWHTHTWGQSPSETQKRASDFYSFEYSVSTNPYPITRGTTSGSTSVQITTQNGNYTWDTSSPYTCDSTGGTRSYSWLQATNINSSAATFDATFSANLGGARTGYIGINVFREDVFVVACNQAGSDT